MTKTKINHKDKLLLGVHLSTSRGISALFDEAERLDINVFQFFIGSPRVWKHRVFSEDECDIFLEKQRRYKFICVHAPYLLNFASNSKKLYRQSIKRALEDIEVMQQLQVKHYVFHPGSSNDTKEGIKLIRNVIDIILGKTCDVTLIVENTAGEKNDIGKNLIELAEITDGYDDRVGLCIDTCHLFASGVNITVKKSLDTFYEEMLALNLHKRVKVIHANDSKYMCGAKRDRHAHINEGFIKDIGFINLFKHPYFSTLPFILETPKELDMDEVNLVRLRRLYNKSQQLLLTEQ